MLLLDIQGFSVLYRMSVGKVRVSTLNNDGSVSSLAEGSKDAVRQRRLDQRVKAGRAYSDEDKHDSLSISPNLEVVQNFCFSPFKANSYKYIFLPRWAILFVF